MSNRKDAVCTKPEEKTPALDMAEVLQAHRAARRAKALNQKEQSRNSDQCGCRERAQSSKDREGRSVSRVSGRGLRPLQKQRLQEASTGKLDITSGCLS